MTTKWKIILISSGAFVAGLAVFTVLDNNRKKNIDATQSTPDDLDSVIASVAANPPSYGVVSYLYNGASFITQPVVNLVSGYTFASSTVPSTALYNNTPDDSNPLLYATDQTDYTTP